MEADPRATLREMAEQFCAKRYGSREILQSAVERISFDGEVRRLLAFADAVQSQGLEDAEALAARAARLHDALAGSLNPLQVIFNELKAVQSQSSSLLQRLEAENEKLKVERDSLDDHYALHRDREVAVATSRLREQHAQIAESFIVTGFDTDDPQRTARAIAAAIRSETP